MPDILKEPTWDKKHESDPSPDGLCQYSYESSILFGMKLISIGMEHQNKEVSILKECLDNAEDILNQISSESNPSYLDTLCKEYFHWRRVNEWRIPAKPKENNVKQIDYICTEHHDGDAYGDIVFDAFAEWDFEKQEWILSEMFDAAICRECGKQWKNGLESTEVSNGKQS
tara:strand:+ start:2376 stop:2888 length:513 start_codon:yes stop_codon:yes gene_type:complete